MDPTADHDPNQLFTQESALYEFERLHRDFSTLEATTHHYMTAWWGRVHQGIYRSMEEIRSELAVTREDPLSWENSRVAVRGRIDDARFAYETARCRLSEAGN